MSCFINALRKSRKDSKQDLGTPAMFVSLLRNHQTGTFHVINIVVTGGHRDEGTEYAWSEGVAVGGRSKPKLEVFRRAGIGQLEEVFVDGLGQVGHASGVHMSQ